MGTTMLSSGWCSFTDEAHDSHSVAAPPHSLPMAVAHLHDFGNAGTVTFQTICIVPDKSASGRR